MIWETGRPVRRNTDPNNARHIIWALGEFFFFPSYYFILTNVLLYLYVLYMTYAKGRGLEGPEGLKLAQTMCLMLSGPLVSFFFSLFVLFDINGFFYCMYRLHLQYTQKREGWRAGNARIDTNGERQGQGEGAREESRGRDQGLEPRYVFFIVLTKTKTLCSVGKWSGRARKSTRMDWGSRCDASRVSRYVFIY